MTVPPGWTVAAIGDFTLDRVRQGPPTDQVHYIDIGAVDRTTKQIGAVESVDPSTAPTRARQWVQTGDVLVSMTRPNLNAVALVPPHLNGSVASTGFDVLRPAGVLPEYLFARVRSHAFVADVCKGVQGVVYPAIRPADVRRHRMSIAPLPEQRRIVEALDSYLSRLDSAVANLERAQARLKAYRASVLKAAVEGRLVPTEAELARQHGRDFEPAPVLLERILAERRRCWEKAELERLTKAGKRPGDDRWKSKYEEPEGPDRAGLPDLPEGWCWAGLAQLGELSRGKSKHRPRNDPRLLGGAYPFIQTGDIRRADTWIHNYSGTYSELGLAQSRLWPAGTLCITIAANIAETAILTFDACFPDSVVGFMAGDPVMTRYVDLFVRTARRQIDKYAPGTAQKNINLDTLNRVLVPLPPAAEQERIVDEVDARLSVATSCTETAASNTSRIARLRQAILGWAFGGKLVDQDPADEPAEAFLARLQSGRFTSVTRRARRRNRKVGR